MCSKGIVESRLNIIEGVSLLQVFMKFFIHVVLKIAYQQIGDS